MKHFEDRIVHCKLCEVAVLIKFNQVGAGIHRLTNYRNKHGVLFNGRFCSKCRDKIEEMKDELLLSQPQK